MTYILYFEDSRGQRRIVATYKDAYDDPERINNFVMEDIHSFCEDRNFRIYYTRVWNDTEHNETCFDVGSHSEFFYVHPIMPYYGD